MSEDLKARMDAAYFRTLAETNKRKGLGAWPVHKVGVMVPVEPDPAEGETPPTLGGRIRRARLAKRFTHMDLACEINVAAGNISDWERDVIPPTDARLRQIAAVLHIGYDWLKEGR